MSRSASVGSATKGSDSWPSRMFRASSLRTKRGGAEVLYLLIAWGYSLRAEKRHEGVHTIHTMSSPYKNTDREKLWSWWCSQQTLSIVWGGGGGQQPRCLAELLLGMPASPAVFCRASWERDAKETKALIYQRQIDGPKTTVPELPQIQASVGDLGIPWFSRNIGAVG